MRLGFFFLAVVLFVVSYYWGNQYKKLETAQLESAVLLRPAMPLPAFEARDHTGSELSPATLHGRWGLLLIGALDNADTRRGLVLVSRIHNRLANQPKLQRELRPLLISPRADTDTDTPAQLRQTVQSYNPGMLAASAHASALAGLLEALGAESRANLYLLDPQVRIQAVFTLDSDPATIARDIGTIHAAHPAP